MSFFIDIFKGHKLSTINLYIATFAMRFSAYLTIALLSYMVDVNSLPFIIIVYSVSEILTVSLFGVLSDTRGRKPVLIFSHLLTTLGVIFYAIIGYLQGDVLTNDLLIIVVVYMPVMFILGAGAASKVTSTLTMIADESDLETRAQYMGFFDFATLGGFAAGFAAGHLFQQLLEFPLIVSFAVAIIIVLISLILVYAFVDETLTEKTDLSEQKASDFLTRVWTVIRTNKDLQKLLPVYIPMISLYGLLITFTKELISDELESISLSAGITPEVIALFAVVGVLGISMSLSLVISGKLSDTKLVRRPFIIIGLICLAILIIMFEWYANQPVGAIQGLYGIWPVVGIIGFGVGAFPPAILAYLTDISKKDTRGTLFGVYSVIFGSGMIFGPLIGNFFFGLFQLTGIVISVVLLVLLSCIGTLFLSEKARETTAD
ncbi:MAG: MFS transporter [Candidatus Hodarchaeales archaeon]